MPLIVRVVLKLALALPLCLATLLGPFFANQWLQDHYGWHVPPFLVLALAMGASLWLYSKIIGKELRESQVQWRLRQQAKQAKQAKQA